MAANSTGGQVPYRWSIAARALAGVVGGYWLAALATVCIGAALPTRTADAVLIGTMLSFLVYLLAVIWAFAAASAGRAWAGLAVTAAVLGAVLAVLNAAPWSA